MKAAAALTGIAIALFGARLAHGRASRPATMTSARACLGVYWDQRAHECSVDQRTLHQFTSDLDCSIRLYAPRPLRFTARLTYEGEIQRSYSAVVRGRQNRAIGIVFPSLGLEYGLSSGLPAGTYGCEFSLGSKRVAFTFERIGSAGTVLAPSVCQGSGTWGHACDHDAAQPSYSPLPPTHTVACSAVFARLRGHAIGIDFLRQGSSGWGTLDSERDVLLYPITEEAAWTSALSGPFLADGHYACRFSVDGAIVAERQFDISS